MRSRVIVVLSAAAFALCGPLPPVAPATAASGLDTSGWKLRWADEFNGRTLSNDWGFRPTRSPSRVCSREVADMAKVSGGSLRISVREDRNPPDVPDGACDYGQYISASIGTAATRTFKYGMFEARIKFAASVGGHGAFWMQPNPRSAAATRTGDPHKDGAEIDVAEYFGDGYPRGGLRNSVHYYERDERGRLVAIRKDTVGEKTPSKFRARNISKDYHVFSVEWTSTEYIFRMDGVVTFRTKRGVSRVPQYLIFSQLTSDWEQRKFEEGPDDMTTKVDWVRVYQRN